MPSPLLPDEPRLLNTRKVADLLSVDDATVRRWCRSGPLPCTELGKRPGYRIDREDLQRFLDERSPRRATT